MIETLFVGIDVGKTFNTVRLLDLYGTTLKLFTVPNDKTRPSENLNSITFNHHM